MKGRWQLREKVLAAIEMRARHSYRDIAALLDVSEQLVQYHCERAVDDGTLLGFNAIVDLPLVGQTFHLLYFRFFGLTSAAEERWLARTNSLPQVAIVARTVGRWNATVGILARSAGELAQSIAAISAPIAGKIAEVTVTTEVECVYSSVQLLHRQKPISWKSAPQGTQRQLDALDLKILTALARDCRTPASQIANDAGVASSTVSRRIDSLEHDGVILGYRAHIDYEKLGLPQYRLLIKLANLAPDVSAQLMKFAIASGRIQSVSRYLGLADVDLRCHASSLEELARFIAELRDRFVSEIAHIDIVPLFFWKRMNYFPVGAVENRSK